MNAALHVIAVGAFAALMATAAFEDFRRLIIPNWLILALIAVWPLTLAAGIVAPLMALGALGIAAAVFLVGAGLFGRGLVGGGDVKLLTVAALWAGPAATPELLLVTAALGGMLSLVLMSPLGGHLSFAGRLFLGPPGAPEFVGKGVPVPYGIAIAGGALFVTLQPFFG